MHDASFLAEVELMSGLGRPEAQRTVRATLKTLAERLGGDRARELAKDPPPGLRPYLAASAAREPFGPADFLRRVARREQVDGRTARDHVVAVFAALGAAVSRNALRDIAAELPREFAPLLAVAHETARSEHEAEIDPVVLDVAERVDVDEHRALRATEAALETLAALRRSVSGDELSGIAATLGEEYELLLLGG